ncbi:MAG: ComEC/Rec2 family competence protein [Verrucomicrobiota bacterium]|jgi:ComEC/Rec2-related protein|nr:ComEC/Rec2 family competence protein [Verrucomicrobiota bacterium]
MTQNKLIAFCYLFIIGIAAAMAFPLGSAAIAPLWLVTAFLALLCIGSVVLIRRQRSPVENDSPIRLDSIQVTAWALILLTAFVLGYTRYLAMIQSPDRLLGHLRIPAEGDTWTARAEMSGTSFLRIKTLAPVQEDIRLRLKGELEALQPVLDGNGLPVLDADGRWNFSLTAGIAQETDEILIPAGTRAGEEILIQQPFTRLNTVEMLNQPASAHLAVLQPVNTVSLFARSGRNVVPANILGRITADPWVYSFKTVLAITPDYIQYQPNGPYFAVARQTIRVTIDPKMPGYSHLARSAAYGYDVALGGELIMPPSAANAGAFDQAKYLRNYNIGGQMTLRSSPDEKAPLSIIIPQGAVEPREGNGLVEFSLYLRDEIVRVIKQTMPQPNSAFLGALTLGLRYGMQNTVSIASDSYADATVAPLLSLKQPTDELIADEFRASGINHVLAVSGLHVTIITIMFMGIFTLMKISRKVYVPFVIFALVIFAIITGARPSTLRACIMNSLFLLTWGYMDQGLRSSALLGVPVAAFIILLQNPAMTVDPSFTLSFGAILSLALLTQPFFDLFKKFRGNDFIVLIIMLGALTYGFAAHWLLTTTFRFWAGYAVLAAATFGLGRLLTRSGFKPIGNFGFADIHPGVSGFIAAQFGMQIGMMIPLSAYYFYRWPVAGAYANLIAIPLVGVVLQLSMLAGLIGLIPGIGMYIALFLNAANWIFSTAFLLIGHYFSRWFLYPFVIKPTLAWMFVYYAFVALFIWWRPIWFRFVRPRWRSAPLSRRWVSATLLLFLLLLVFGGLHRQKQDLRKSGELSISILSIGYGSAILVDTPDDKAILIDTAFVQTDRGRRNDAERTILPYICARQIKSLDALILTAPGAEHTAGAATILKYMDTKRLLYPASVEPLLQQPPLAAILEERAPGRFKHRMSGTTIVPEQLTAGRRLFESTMEDGQVFYIDVLGPQPADADAPLSLRIVYGDFAVFLPSDLTFAQQRNMLANTSAENLKATVALAPNHGTTGMEDITIGIPQDYERNLANITGALLQRTGAEAVVFEFGNPRPVVGDQYKVAVKLYGTAKRIAEDILPEARHFATDTDGAITLTSDGRTYVLQARYDMAAGEADAPTSLEIGW